jgi:5-methylcytosine-specific restriction enzyme subunit McrC
MSSIFEAYLLRLLKLVAAANHWPVTVLDGNKLQPVGGGKRLFDGSSPPEATPDIVIAKGTVSRRIHPVLIEVKYKPLPDRDDINQAIAYATSYRCDEVIIAQPKATNAHLELGLSLLGRIDNLTVHRYIFDLGAADLTEQENLFTSAVLATSTGVAMA